MGDVDDPGETATLANHTLAWMRRLDGKFEKVLELLVRHETRLHRLEREVGEIKTDQGATEGALLRINTDLMRMEEKIDNQGLKLEQLELRSIRLDSKMDVLRADIGALDGRVERIEVKMG